MGNALEYFERVYLWVNIYYSFHFCVILEVRGQKYHKHDTKISFKYFSVELNASVPMYTFLLTLVMLKTIVKASLYFTVESEVSDAITFSAFTTTGNWSEELVTIVSSRNACIFVRDLQMLLSVTVLFFTVARAPQYSGIKLELGEFEEHS